MQEFSHVSLHQHIQVIKKPPANEVISFPLSTIEHTVIYNLFSTFLLQLQTEMHSDKF